MCDACNQTPQGIRQCPLTPNEVAKLRALRRLKDARLAAMVPAWAKPKRGPAQFRFIPGEPPKFPAWTGPFRHAPCINRIPDETDPAEYIRQYHALNYLKA